jgi:AsmA protein
MKIVVGFFATFLLLIMVAVVAVPLLLPLDKLVQELQLRVNQSLGRELRLEAPSVSVFPNLVISMERVSLASPSAFSHDLLSIGSVDIDVAWSSVWRGEVVVERFTLSDWTLFLATNKQGEVNWAMGPQAQESSSNSTIQIPDKVDVGLNNVALQRGTVIVTNAMSGQSSRIENIDVALNMPSLDGVMSVDGQLSIQGESLAGHMALTNVRDFLAANTSQLTLQLEGFQNRINFNGSVSALGQRLSGDLVLGDVDLRPLLSSAVETSNQSSTQAPSEGWSNAPIDLSGFIGPELDIAITMNSLRTPWVNTGVLTSDLTLRGGSMVMDISQFSAYGGSGSGIFRIDAKQSMTRSNFDLRGIDIQPLLQDLVGIDKLLGQGDVNFSISGRVTTVQSLMESLAGKTSVALSDGAVLGFNLAAILKSAQSAIKGDFASVSLDQNFSSAEKTDFSAMSASFTVNNGVMHSTDTLLLSPLLRVSGEGRIDLPGQGVDYLLTSRLVASSVGQGAAGDESGVAIPVAIRGPWSDISVSPKLSAALKEKTKAKVEEAKQQGKQKLEGELDKIIDKNLKDDDKKKLLKDLFSR